VFVLHFVFVFGLELMFDGKCKSCGGEEADGDGDHIRATVTTFQWSL